ncbi:MAG: gamma-glutamylputrescine oxidase [marine bacterium B5-7]|nr:MAG: gamma-glutamylputrescine oxidase [marine bacterium B5-7]
MSSPNASRKSLLYMNDQPGRYPQSWYAETADTLPEQPALKGEHSYDIAVIGGGYSGLSCALDLAERGYRVALIEAHRVGWGASGRNGGQIGTGQRLEQDELEDLVGDELARAAWDIAEQAKARVYSLIEKFDIQCDLKPGELHVNHRPRFDRHSKSYAEFVATCYGYNKIRYVEPDEISAMLGTHDYSGGTLDMGAGHLHPLNYALGLARAALSKGVDIFERSEVSRIEPGDRVVVHGESGKVSCRYLVLACNGYLGDLETRVAERVMPINNFIIATEPLGQEVARSLIRDDVCVADSRFVINYYRLSADHRLLFGGGENYGYRFPADIKQFVRPHMLKIYPQLADTQIDYGWGGTLAITRKRLPHFERLAGNILSISGYSGSGVALATGAGAIAAEAIDGVATRFDVMNKLPTPKFPGGSRWRSPLLVLAMIWFSLRDRF